MIENRTFVILNWCQDRTNNVIENIINKIGGDSDIYVFSSGNNLDNISENLKNGNLSKKIKLVVLKDDNSGRSKFKNDALRYFKDKNFTGFLHVIEDSTIILKDPSNFIFDLESMMTEFGINVWLNTSCDPLNYIYSKYSPRLIINLESKHITKNLNTKKLLMCSFSNTQWVVYHIGTEKIEDILFCEDFNIQMYYIIEFLARRRANNIPFCYMNMYPTIESELGCFRRNEQLISIGVNKVSNESESVLFNNKSINVEPTRDINDIMECIKKKLSQE